MMHACCGRFEFFFIDWFPLYIVIEGQDFGK